MYCRTLGEELRCKMIENREGKNPNTDQGRVLEVFIQSAFEFIVYYVYEHLKGVQDTFDCEQDFDEVINVEIILYKM